MKRVLWFLAVLLLAGAAPADDLLDPKLYASGDVVLRELPGRLLVGLDAADAQGVKDGIVDRVFFLLTEEERFGRFDRAKIVGANVESSLYTLRITVPSEKIWFEFDVADKPEGATRQTRRVDRGWNKTRYEGFGLVTAVPPDGVTLAVDELSNLDTPDLLLRFDNPEVSEKSPQAMCDSGGHGAQSCSITCGNTGCGVGCSVYYGYACCKCFALSWPRCTCEAR